MRRRCWSSSCCGRSSHARSPGKAMLATAANRLAARLVGINTSAVVGLSFMISAAIGAVGGILVAPITLTNYDVGTLLALKAFAAAMLGGMGNPLGAVVGGLLLGLLEAFGAGYVSSQYKDAVAFLVILLVLFAMPQGLFGSSKSSGCNVARLLSNPLLLVVRPRVGGRAAASGFAIDILSTRRGARLHQCARGARPQSADGICRTGQPRPCGLLRDRRLCGGGRADASRDAVMAVADRGTALAALVAFVVGRPILKLRGYYLAVATLGMGMLIAMVFSNEAQHHRRSERHAGAAAGPVRVARRRPAGLVLDFRCDAGDRRLDRRQPDRKPDRTRAARHPRQRDRRARARHRLSRATSCIAFVLSAVYAAIAGAYLALFDGFVTPETRRLPALDRIRRHGGAGRARLDPRQHRRRRHPGHCCRRC